MVNYCAGLHQVSSSFWLILNCVYLTIIFHRPIVVATDVEQKTNSSSSLYGLSQNLKQ